MKSIRAAIGTLAILLGLNSIAVWAAKDLAKPGEGVVVAKKDGTERKNPTCLENRQIKVAKMEKPNSCQFYFLKAASGFSIPLPSFFSVASLYCFFEEALS